MTRVKRQIRKFILVTNKSYGNRFKGYKIYYEGAKPKLLKDDGTFRAGKTILEFLSSKFRRFNIIISKKSKIKKKGRFYNVYIATNDLNQIQSQLFTRGRDLKQRVIAKKLSEILPKYFKEDERLFNYEKGMFAGVLTKNFMPTILSSNDRKAFGDFIPRFIASGIAGKNVSVSGKLKSGLELKVLQEIALDLKKRIKADKSESTWQDYLKDNILHIQQGYIAFIEKANIGIIITKFPDFLLVTNDGYLDILEIKTPFTDILLEDKSRGNHYWTTELSKAISQVENYIDEVSGLRDKVKNEIKDKYGIELRVVRPRGVILVGNTEQFEGNKKISDDFRLLNQGLKNITIVTYDELLIRMQNYITALTDLKKR